jgi:hypothetical protein
MVTISMQPRPGHRHHSAECTASGVALTIQTSVDAAGVSSILVPAPEQSAVTCVLTAEAVP